MPQTIFVRPARNGEGHLLLEWSKDQPEWDASIAYQPRTFTLAAYDKNKIIMFLPTQQPYMLETAAINPEASDLETASAFREIVQALVTQAHANGVSELYFLGSDDGTSAFAANHIFQKLPFTVYRCRINDLESAKEG